MKFNSAYLKDYERLMKNTNLQKGYQEFCKLFRYIKIKLEKAYPTFPFSKNIVENNMDYSYFQLTSAEMKAKGLKIVVTFVHHQFQLEVWLSGINRKFQIDYYQKIKNDQIPFELNHQPDRVDYIIKNIVNQPTDIADGEQVIYCIQQSMNQLLNYVNRRLL